MRVVLVIGSHPRHAYIARSLAKAGFLSAMVIEVREAHIPQAPEMLDPELKALFNLHFAKRSESETNFFGAADLPDVAKIYVPMEELNSSKVVDFIRSQRPDVLISYGVHVLSDEIIGLSQRESWNIHGGLSPWYRGTTTHFWPSYFLEPQMTGMTLHNLTQKIDGGAIVHQTSAEMVRGDGLHDLACRAVKGIGDELPRVIQLLEEKGKLEKKEQKTSGKLWNWRDWRPEHLRIVYGLFDDKIVDLVLDGKIEGKIPKLFRQF